MKARHVGVQLELSSFGANIESGSVLKTLLSRFGLAGFTFITSLLVRLFVIDDCLLHVNYLLVL